MDFYSHGKLLLTGEYLVLDGAKALAFPTRKGQSMTVNTFPSHNGKLEWKSFTHEGELWFEALFDRNFQLLHQTNENIASTLQKMLITCAMLNPDFQITNEYVEVETRLEFPENWGLGSSSTLLSSLARWADVDPYQLLDQSFSGSGYDLACATAESSILYTRKEDKVSVEPVTFNPDFRNSIWFIHLNEKQKSSKEILRYRELEFDKTNVIESCDKITYQLLETDSLESFNRLLEEHEQLLSDVLGIKTAKQKLFSDYDCGVIKSLGAWGGDFILATGNEQEVMKYFNTKGYTTVVSWNDMLL